MNKSRHIVAIEIGSSMIKGAVGEVEPGGSLTVRAVEEEKQSPNYVRYGGVQNVKEVANVLNGIIMKLNNRISPAKVSAVYLGVGGRSLMAVQRQIDITLPEELEITHDMVDELLERAKSSLNPDREVVEVEPGEFVVDNMSITVPVGTVGRTMSAEVNVINCRAQMLRNLNLAVTEKLGLKINGYVVRQTALAEMVLTDDERLGVMLVDCGAETSTVSIYKGGVLRYLNTVPLGSRHITRDIMALHYSEERAEELKKAVGNANPHGNMQSGLRLEGIDDTEINNYVSARAGEIVVNVAEQISYAGLSAADLPSGIVVVGGGSMLAGFCDELGDFTNMTVRRGTLPSSVKQASGSKIRMADDVDVIALLYKLSKEATAPCVTVTAPKVETVQQNVSAADGRKGNDNGFDSDDDDIERIPGRNFLSKLWGKIKEGVTPPEFVDDDDEEEDD